MHPDEIVDKAVVEEKLSKQGMLTLKVRLDDSPEWTVGVVPDVAFEHLDHSVIEGDYHDADDNAVPFLRGIF
jgi:hypothetical protein